MIRFGDVDAIADLLKKIAAREGIGDILADGIRAAAAHWGLEDLAIHVKGLEPAGYDPRALKGMGLTFATSPRGACHLRTTFYKPELSGIIDPAQIEHKAKLLTEYEDRLNIFDTLVICRFYRDLYPWDELIKVLPLLTGVAVSQESLRRDAARIATMTRRFNLREGLQPGDDRLPSRLHKNALPDGRTLTADEMEYMLKDYYSLRGWDSQGVPQQD